MSLQTPRQKWLMACLTDCFGFPNHSKVEDYFNHPDVLPKIRAFMAGQGPPILTFFYQRPEAHDSYGEPNDSGDPEIFLTVGDTDRIKGKCAYFIRNTPEGKPVNTQVPSDETVLHGEIGVHPITNLELLVGKSLVPMIKQLDEGDWGVCDPEQKSDFVSGLEKFSDELTEAISSLSGGVELRKPDKEFEMEYKQDSRTMVFQDDKIMNHFEGLLAEWNQHIERYLDEGTESKTDSNDSGPRTELEHWRSRNQKLTSISEQMRTKEIKNVISVLSGFGRNVGENQSRNKDSIILLLNKWKNLDIRITEALNEAKDNVKYLTTLEKFIEPLYNGTPQQIIDSLQPLMNAVKMIHTIARYYNTSDRMTQLFMKITNQMINNCKRTILQGKVVEKLWTRDPDELIETMQVCINLNTAYQSQYETTKQKLETMPKGKQFDFSKNQIFGKFDLFCRRLTKLIDMFSTIRQFKSLEKYNLEDMDDIIQSFKKLIAGFQAQRHDLLDYTHNRFDREFVEFNVGISKLEQDLLGFIHKSFEQIPNIEQALKQLRKFKAILKRESLQNELQNKYMTIFNQYSKMMNEIKDQYTQYNNSPPLVRNMPPVAGNIKWARHLFARNCGPMEKFPEELKKAKESRTSVNLHNRIGDCLVLYEYLYLQAWCQEIEKAKAGLQATLIIKHPDNHKYFVNFDQEIMQLIREAKCLDRMSIEIPESARIVLLQEEKFKMYYNELMYVLKEYERVISKIRPIIRPLLGPHQEDLDYKLRPGLVTLTWTSMNIDGYLHHVHTGLQKFEQLIISINDIIENRIENNLKTISKVILVEMPENNKTYSQDEFVELQHRSVKHQTEQLTSKNIEVERAVDDLLQTIKSYPLDQHVEKINPEEIIKLKKYYNWTMYQALLHATKNSLNAMKERVCGKRVKGSAIMPKQSAFFEVTVQLVDNGPEGTQVSISPTLEDVQEHINRAAIAVLKCSKSIFNWFQQDKAENEEKESFYDMVAQDKEIVKVILLLTGSIHGTKKVVGNYLNTFSEYLWLWTGDIEKKLAEFSKKDPDLDDFDEKLKSFKKIEQKIDSIPETYQIGAMALMTANIKLGLKDYVNKWKNAFSRELHKRARTKLENVLEYVNQTKTKMQKEVSGIDTLRYVMQTLREIRQKEGEIELELKPIKDMYQILENFAVPMEKDEQDHNHVLPNKWKELVKIAEARQNELHESQNSFKRDLIRSVKFLIVDVKDFRKEYEKSGPMVTGIPPKEAVERLRRFKEEYSVRERNYEINRAGEELFGLPHQPYPDLDQTKKELDLLTRLYDLYVQVIETVNAWKEMTWFEAVERIDTMQEQTETFGKQCKALPRQLKEWEAYIELSTEIDNFSKVLPLLKDLSKPSIRPRHWEDLKKCTGAQFKIGAEEIFYLSDLLDANLLQYKEDVEEIVEAAQKQLKIEEMLKEIKEYWDVEFFEFEGMRGREVQCSLGGSKVQEIQEKLDDDQGKLTTMNAMKQVTPFKKEVVEYMTIFADVGETIDRWVKVQMLWRSLEPVFMSGDIAKSLPTDARRFQTIDKNWMKIMERAVEARRVIPCCQNDMLKSLLPSLQEGLEACQKSLESYLESKRGKFARFFFVSDPVLLTILSQGSEPNSIQPFLENLFDAITKVTFDSRDKKMICEIIGSVGRDEEKVTLSEMVKAEGNIEDWLKKLEEEMQRTMRDILRNASRDALGMGLTDFIGRYTSQVSLVGIQILWTHHVQEGLEKMAKDKNIIAQKKNKIREMMEVLLKMGLGVQRNRLEKTKLETLVTIHVHQRDVFEDLQAFLSKDTSSKGNFQNNFEWLKQTRLSWKGELDTVMISITDQDFHYLYEYLGTKERLCITPLTDRCYITLAQALGMHYGGAPAGPAGTGKTETVKDLGRTLGVFVVVTNCSDQHRYRDMAKIFKGLCMSGLWGCFDEFNRIELEVLSVVAMQVAAITTAKKTLMKMFSFPGEPTRINLVPTTAYFITMNPGYAGRQELPENLKVLFRGVAMMVPDFQVIIEAKLASFGFSDYKILAKKFKVLYGLCSEQLSKQRHYDYGLRNILSVLRTAGPIKKENQDAPEDMLLMRALRDMNLSMLVADDVPLFLQLLRDVFPTIRDPPKVSYDDVEAALTKVIGEEELVAYPEWRIKCIQLYEKSRVRHGFMVVGPTGSGKTTIINVLTKALGETGIQHKCHRLNPKAFTSKEMYGVKNEISDEWTPGVFSTIWKRYNNRTLKYNSWIICDGPVDAVWIENLNTVLDDNKILTLANNDRIPMTENVKLVFEVQDLDNASPATVSRCGIIYVSAKDLGWKPLVEAWVKFKSGARRAASFSVSKPEEAERLNTALMKYLETQNIMESLYKQNFKVSQVMNVNNAIIVSNILTLLLGLVPKYTEGSEVLDPLVYEKLVVYALAWTVGSMFEPEDRAKFHEYMGSLGAPLPRCDSKETIYDYVIDTKTKDWTRWQAEAWKRSGKIQFASLLIPTMDSTRAEFLIKIISDMPLDHPYRKHVLLLGGPGTAKTSTILMYCSKLPNNMVLKKMNFSSATLPKMFQDSIEADVVKNTGKNYWPQNNKIMVVFIDDLSMPFVNLWGDQETLEIVRQLIEQGGFYFLDKDNRGDFKKIDNLMFMAAMNHPGGGRNNIPNRCKRHFFSFNMVLPSVQSVDNIYGEMTRVFFVAKTFGDEIVRCSAKLTGATIDLWERVKKRFLPTPSQFHYLFNMRELSRVFQGVFECIKVRQGVDVILKAQRVGGMAGDTFLVGLWKHECMRVFEDKLTTQENKDEFKTMLEAVTLKSFGQDTVDKLANDLYFADFQREDVYNEEGELIEPAPKVYEAIKSINDIKKIVHRFLDEFNTQSHGKSMNLVLFEDALKHLMRISRTIQMDRGNALLVGVGGSGKQSLTRLAAFIGKHVTFQIQLTKSYNVPALFEDLKFLYKTAGHEGKKTTFVLTDVEIKDEVFLEYINSILSTGEVANLLPKEEKDIIIADMRTFYQKEKPQAADPTDLELNNYFIDRVRQNLHCVLCFSPVGDKFRERFRKFPAVFNGCTINWFLPWPEEALVSVSSSFINNFEVHATPEVKQALTFHMGRVHNMVKDVCSIYFNKMRRYVYVTPKSYLSFISSFKEVYVVKKEELEEQEHRVNLGLQKLQQAKVDVERMQVELDAENRKLQETVDNVEKLLKSLNIEKAAAQKKSEEVAEEKAKCELQAATIQRNKEEADRDLQAAMPYLEEAVRAVNSIQQKDIVELKTNRKPLDIIRLVLDGALILQVLQIVPVRPEKKNIKKETIDFFHDSFDEYGMSMVGDIKFLTKLMDFSENEKDNITEETCELLEPYLQLENFNQDVARNASQAAAGLCKWVGAMVQYHATAKIVKPKMDFLEKQKGLYSDAMEKLNKAIGDLEAAQAILDEMQKKVDAKVSEKNKLQERTARLKKKMDQAKKLLDGLTDEKVRWTEDSNNFADLKRRLAGDVAVATAFVSYCGPFNSEFRNMLMKDYFITDLKNSNIPVTVNLELTRFLIEKTIVAEWNLQGLPKDDLSTQNGIMVTRSTRYPLMIDPQGQAHRWICNKEAENLKITNQSAKDFKDIMGFCLEEGLSLLLENIENEVDPGIDPVLEKQVVIKGRSRLVKLGDQHINFSEKFLLFMTSRLANPHFSPELAAKTTIIDFTVTLTGLEQQLLGRVLSKESRSLEESMQNLLEEINSNAKSLVVLDKQLLERLTNSDKNLIEDTELVEVLNNTKVKSRDVQMKITEAEDKQKDINEKREQYRPVATRGSILYFCIVEMSLVNWMYNTSLNQFLQKFDESVEKADKAPTPNERVKNIIKSLTYTVYRYINRGLFEKDKITFVLMVCIKILIIAGKLTPLDISILLNSGGGLDSKTERPNPFKWLTRNNIWMNILALSRHHFGKDNLCFFRDLPDSIARNDPRWKSWYEAAKPEEETVPDFQEQIQSEKEIGKFIHLTLVRAIREDRTIVFALDFISGMLGKEYTDPVTDTIDSIWQESSARVPVLFLLSAGADPTNSIEELAKKKRKFPVEQVSMGEGQDEIARETMKASFLSGRWVVLSNCHLGLKFMAEMETTLGPGVEIEEDFRLWLSCEPRERFPIGLLQMAIKVTNEPPKGLKAGLTRTFSTIIDNDFLEKHDGDKWRKITYSICFLHSVVQERRKFGPLGWCVPYEFNNSDLEASLTFLDRHIYNTETSGQQPSWETIRFMVCEVQYGGRITDSMDFELFRAFGSEWIDDKILAPSFTFNPGGGDLFSYKIPDGTDVQKYIEYIEGTPSIDNPTVFYLNPSADLTFRQREVNEVLNTITITQPKEGGTGTGKSRDDIIFEKVQELQEKMPPDYIEVEIRDNIRRLGGPKGITDRGMSVPLNIFLFQELMRLQKVIAIMKKTLVDLVEVKLGNIILTQELQASGDSLFDTNVPKAWLYDASGVEISWMTPKLGNWIGYLQRRVNQFDSWLKNGRPNHYWLAGFFNPQGFLTAVKQEVTRQNKAQNWALDDVVEVTEVKDIDINRIREPPVEGVYVSGLLLEGAMWNKVGGKLEELNGKDTIVEMSPIYVTAKSRDRGAKGNKEMDSYGLYSCPCYKYPMRTDRYYVFHVNLNSGEGQSNALHWKLRGVALLCVAE